MANWNNNEPCFGYAGHATLGVNLNRQKNAPLDISCEFSSIKDALYYVTEGRYPVSGEGVSTFVKDMKKYPYLGQIIAIVNVETEEVSLYYIKTSEYNAELSTDNAVFTHYFEEVGKSTTGDNRTISLSEDGVLSLTNFGVKYYHWVDAVGEEGQEDYVAGHHELVTVDAEHPWISGLEPRVVTKEGGGFELAWYEPSTTTVEGLNSTVGTLSADVETAQTDISNLQEDVGNDGTDGNPKTGLYAEIATAEEEISTIQETLGSSSDSLSESVDTVWAHVNKNTSDIATINGKLTGVFHFKGAPTDGQLSNVVDPEVGDVYTVGSKEYAWSGTEWTELGFTTDLSAYSTTEQINSAIATAKSEAISAAETDATTKANTAESNAKAYAKEYADGLAPNYAPASVTGRVTTAESDIVALKSKTAGLVNAEGAEVSVKSYVDAADAALGSRIDAINTSVTNLGALAHKDAVAESDLNTELAAKLHGKADQATTLAGYGIVDAHTKSEVTDLLAGKVDTTAIGTMAAENKADYTKTADLPTALADTFDAKGSAAAVDTKVTALDLRVAANESAIAILNGDAQTAGSVAKKIDTAIANLDLANTYAAKVHDHTVAQITGLQDTLNGLQSAIDGKQDAGDYATKTEAQGYASTAETNAKNYADGLAINYAPASDSKRISDIEADIVIFKGTGEGSIDAIASAKAEAAATAAVNEFAANISDDGTVNTFKELVDYVAEHSPEAANMAADILALKADTHTHENKTVLDQITEEKVTAWDAAEANVLEIIKFNGVAATIVDKAVDIPAATADVLGLVKVDNDTIKAADGVISVDKIGVSKLYVEEGVEFILDGGVA